MLVHGAIKVVVSVGKGLIVVAKGPTAKIIAVAAAVGIVTISVALAAGMYFTIRTFGKNTPKTFPNPSGNSKQITNL